MRKSSRREREGGREGGRERLDESMWQNSSYVVGCYSEEKNIGCGDVFIAQLVTYLGSSQPLLPNSMSNELRLTIPYTHFYRARSSMGTVYDAFSS